jgi:hypothetical protein
MPSPYTRGLLPGRSLIANSSFNKLYTAKPTPSLPASAFKGRRSWRGSSGTARSKHLARDRTYGQGDGNRDNCLT